jgi:hypothetical protein
MCSSSTIVSIKWSWKCLQPILSKHFIAGVRCLKLVVAGSLAQRSACTYVSRHAHEALPMSKTTYRGATCDHFPTVKRPKVQAPFRHTFHLQQLNSNPPHLPHYSRLNPNPPIYAEL